MKPPPTITLRFCTACGRTDRNNFLSNNHHHEGKRCPGPLITVIYVKESPK